jgi:Outer membrane protein beta-barrel domain
MKQKLHSFVWKSMIAAVFMAFSTLSANSQILEKASFFEAGITVAPSNFLGDLGGNYGRGTTFLKDNNFQMTKLMFGAFLSYHPNEWLGFRLNGNFGQLEGDDAIINNKGGLEEMRKIRNSNFRSKVAEAFLAAEIYPTVFFEYEPSDLFHKLRPYGLIGVGVFHFDPEGTDPLNGNWVKLKPLRTEGQGMAEYPDRPEYKLTQLNIPMGLGLKYFLSDKTALSLEVIHRKTFTDYIDDVSTKYIDPALFYNYMPLQQAQLAQRMANKTDNGLGSTVFRAGNKRGTATNNDSYYSFGFKLSIRLGNNGDNRWRNSTRCPVTY